MFTKIYYLLLKFVTNQEYDTGLKSCNPEDFKTVLTFDCRPCFPRANPLNQMN